MAHDPHLELLTYSLYHRITTRTVSPSSHASQLVQPLDCNILGTILNAVRDSFTVPTCRGVARGTHHLVWPSCHYRWNKESTLGATAVYWVRGRLLQDHENIPINEVWLGRW